MCEGARRCSRGAGTLARGRCAKARRRLCAMLLPSTRAEVPHARVSAWYYWGSLEQACALQGEHVHRISAC
eukprot:8997888-Alexandrium_andersonii.AAC.1